MQQYNVFQAIYMSFYSKQLYRDVAENWGGKTFLFLLLVLALSWIIFTVDFHRNLTKDYSKKADKYVAQLPVVTIKEGKLSTPENRPYIITDPDTKEQVIMIDASGQNTTIEQSKTKILITDNAVISQTRPDQVKIYRFPSDFNMTVDPETANSYVNNFLNYGWAFFYIIFLASSYIYRILQSLIYGLIGKIFSAVNHIPLSYSQTVQIAMVALAPVIIINSIFSHFNISFILQHLFYFALAMLYLIYGILANKKTQ